MTHYQAAFYMALAHLGALIAYALAGWSVAVCMGVRRGMPGFGPYVWAWPFWLPLMVLKEIYAGIRSGIATAFHPEHIADEQEE